MRRVPDWLKSALIMVGVLVLLTSFCMVASVLVAVTSVRNSEPYQHSVDLALNNLAVEQALGVPIEIGRFPQGAVNTAIGGDAELYIPLHGSQQNASIRVNASRSPDGTWKYYAVRVDTADGQHINLLENK